MDLDLNTIVNALVAIIGAGGIYGGARYGYNRIMAARAEARMVLESEFGPMNTGKIQLQNLVTRDDCSIAQKRTTESMNEVRKEVKEGLQRNSDQLTKLSDSISEIKTALASQEGAIIKGVGFGVREHERRFHGTRSSTGDYPKR